MPCNGPRNVRHRDIARDANMVKIEEVEEVDQVDEAMERLDHDTRRLRPQKMEESKPVAAAGWLKQIEAQAASFPQPPGCLPVAVGMALDQLLIKLRMAADIEVTESFDKSESSLRALSDASLYEITEHVYDNLEQVVEQLKWRWRAENAEFAERANAWRWRRQGWFLLLGESEEGSVLVTADREMTFVVRGMEMSLSAKLRTKLPEAELPAAVWLTLLPWEGYITYDGLMACRALPPAQRAKLQRDLQPQYEEARDALDIYHKGGGGGAAGVPLPVVQGARTEEACIEEEALPAWATRAFGRGAMLREGHRKYHGDEEGAAGGEAGDVPPLVSTCIRQLRPDLARYAPQPHWPEQEGPEAPLVMAVLSREAKLAADAAFKAAEHERAMRLYSVAMGCNPHKGEEAALLGNRSLAQLRMGQPDAALSDALAATISAPDWPKGWARKAMALKALGDHAAALAAAEHALELSPEDKAFRAMRDELSQLLAATPSTIAPPPMGVLI